MQIRVAQCLPKAAVTLIICASLSAMLAAQTNAPLRTPIQVPLVDDGADPRLHPGWKPQILPLFAPLFLEDAQFKSILVLGSGAMRKTYADVIVKGLDGTSIARQRVDFAPHSQQRVDLGALLQASGSSVTVGSVTILPSHELLGPTIVGQLIMTYIGSKRTTYLDEELAMPGTESTEVLRAVADQGEGAAAVVAITSLSTAQQQVKLDCIFEQGPRTSKVLELNGGQTIVTQACEKQNHDEDDVSTLLASTGEHSHGATGIAVTSSVPGGIVAFALASHGPSDDRSFSAISFSDPGMAMSPNLIFVGVPVGDTAYLSDGRYQPQISLANFGTKDTQVEIKYAQSSGDTPSARVIDKIVVPAKSSRTVIPSGLQGDSHLQNSFVISSDANAGDLSAKLTSRGDQTLRQVELLGKDEKDQQNGGNHPWSIEGSDESTLLLFNHSAVPKLFGVQIAGNGTVWDKSYTLQSMQTKALSLRRLIDDRVQDDNGKTIPEDVVSGQIQWFTMAYGEGKGRLIHTNRDRSMARSYSCGTYDVICGAGFSPGVTTFGNGSTVGYGSASADWCATNSPSICRGEYTGHTTTAYYSWSIANQSIAAISGSNTAKALSVTGMSPGSTTVHHTVYAGFCSGGGQNPATVQQPNQIYVTWDTTGTVNCPLTSFARTITYSIEDTSGSPMTMPIPIHENVPPTSSSCNNQAVQTGSGCVLNNQYAPGALNEFNDYLWAGCPSSLSVEPCGYTFANQQWQYCPASKPPSSIGTVGQDIVNNNSISVDGNTTNLTTTTFKP
jgi:hypothetical protein